MTILEQPWNTYYDYDAYEKQCIMNKYLCIKLSKLVNTYNKFVLLFFSYLKICRNLFEVEVWQTYLI